MGQAIEQRRGHLRIDECGGPFGEAQVPARSRKAGKRKIFIW